MRNKAFLTVLLALVGLAGSVFAQTVNVPSLIAEAQRLQAEAQKAYPAKTWSIEQPLWRQAADVAEKAVAAAPTNASALRVRATVYSGARFWARAESAWNAYFRVAGDSAQEDRNAMAEVQFNLGFAAFERGEPEPALERFRTASALNPAAADPVIWQARLTLERGDANAALPLWERAAQLAPQDASVKYYLTVARKAASYGQAATTAFMQGMRLYERGDRAAALEQFREAARAAPAFTEAQRWLGRASLESNAGADAVQAYEAVVRLEGQTAQNKYQLDYAREVASFGLDAVRAFRQGYDLYTKGNKDAALQQFVLATETNNDYQKAWSWLGRVRLETGDVQGAIAAYERAVALDPNDRPTAFGLQQARAKLR